MKHLLFFITLFSCISIYSQQIIPLTPNMVTNESGFGIAGNIVDEQTLSGDPLNNTGGDPINEWHAGWNASNYPASVYINLGTSTALSKVFIYDNNGADDLIVEYGTPGNWQPLFIDLLPNYQDWNMHSVSVNTQYIRLTATSSGAHFNEIMLYGQASQNNDVIAPSSINNLNVTATTAQSISLSFTASGDDNNVGTATSYDLRYSTNPINSSNFNLANHASGIPTPSVSGSSESITVTGLNSQTTYYFAIKVIDDNNNISPISNIVNDNTINSSGGLPILTKTYIHKPAVDPQWNSTPIYNSLEPADFDSHWASLLASLPTGNASWNGGNINLGVNGTGYGEVQWNSASSSNKKPILVQLPSAGGAPGIGICPMDSRFIVCSAMNNASGSVSGAAEYEIVLLAIQQMIKNIQASGKSTDDVFIIGKSQGGGTGLMTASLNEDVKDFFLSVPALSGFTGSGGTAGGFPGYASNNTNAYVDACNHAKRYRNKASFSISYDDAVTWGRGQVTDARNTQFTTTIYHGNDGHSDPTWWSDGSDWLDSCLINIVDNGRGLPGNTTSIKQEPKQSYNKIYPNPSNGIINYLFKTPKSDKINLLLYNVNGSLVYNDNKQLNAGPTNGSINFSHLKPGVYFLKVEGKHININKRIVLK